MLLPDELELPVSESLSPEPLDPLSSLEDADGDGVAPSVGVVVVR